MLEIGILVCLAVIFFLALKNFSKTKENFIVPGPSDEPKLEASNMKKSIFSKLFKKKTPEDREDIIAVLEEDKYKIVAPAEVNEAQKAYNEADPEIAKTLYEADMAIARGDLREAEDLALDAILKDKKCAHSYVIIGKVAYSRGSFDDAKEAYKTALKSDSETAEAYYGLGQIELKDENFSEALLNLQKAVNIDRGVAEWYAELGKAYMQVRQFARATKALKRAASLDIDNREYKELASEAEDKQRAHSSVYRFK